MELKNNPIKKENHVPNSVCCFHDNFPGCIIFHGMELLLEIVSPGGLVENGREAQISLNGFEPNQKRQLVFARVEIHFRL